MSPFQSDGYARKITMAGMLICLTFIMIYTVLGTIPLGVVEATIGHLPTIVGAIAGGPVMGLITGLAMGIMAMVRAITQPSQLLSPFLANPVVAILPRILIGITAYYSYAGLRRLSQNHKQGEALSIAVGAAIGSLTNTVGVLGLLYLIYAQDIFAAMGQSGTVWQVVGIAFLGIAGTNGLVEMAIITILTTAIVLAMQKARLVSPYKAD